MYEFWVLVKQNYDFSWWDFSREIFCEDGKFYDFELTIKNSNYTPIIFNSKETAKEAKKIIGGHWPKYRIYKITDPSWLN